MWLWERTRGEVRQSVFTANSVCGITAGGASSVTIASSHITESGLTGGIALRDSAQATIIGNTVVRNFGAGVALYHGRCMGTGHLFTGRVTGGGNVLRDNDRGRVCPGELEFLAEEWGELDFRR